MTRQRDLVLCDQCGRATREAKAVVLQVDGRTLADVRLCGGCRYEATRTLERLAAKKAVA